LIKHFILNILIDIIMVRFFIIIALCLTISCSNNKAEHQISKTLSSNSSVVSGKPQATEAGISILEKGGNAVDAAVATAFVLSVVEPSMSGIGGRMQAIIRLNDDQIIGLDATTEVPLAYDVNTVSKEIYGYHVIGVPGVVAGLCELQEKYGNLDLETVMSPAISLAENGFPMGKVESQMHSAVFSRLQEFEGTRMHFLKKDGSSYKEGETFTQPELAKTLKLIAKKGKDVFYSGIIAEKIVEDNQRNGGVLSLEDLANYQVKYSKVLQSSYRGYDIYGLWLPSFGAITIEIMNILEVLPMQKYSDTEWIKSVYKAMVMGYADRKNQFLSDTSAMHLTSKNYAKKLSERILKSGNNDNKRNQEQSDLESTGHTTNLVTSDRDGMMVVLTQSLGPIMGSKVATPGLGFMHATASGKYLMAFEPGMRTNSHISPMIIEKDGKPYLGIGAAGGSRIVTAIVNVLSRIIDQEMSISEALLAPRVFPNPDSIHLEVGNKRSWDPEIIEKLKEESFPISTKPDLTHFGIVHAILFDTISKEWIPAAEPDWDGLGSTTLNNDINK